MLSETLHILLIEDNEEHAALIARHLSRASRGGVDLVHKETLDAGLNRIREGGIDALLLDLRLPDSDLRETLPKTLEASSHVPIIVLSSLEDRDLAVEMIHSGAQDYLVKSSLSDELLIRSIRNAIERKRIERCAQKAREEAEAANVAKDRFFAALSHELRTPLTPALMICSVMEGNDNLDKTVRDSISVVRKNLEVEKLLINDLLDFTQINRGTIELRRECVDLHALITHITELFVEDEAKNKQVTFRKIFAASETHVFGDPTRLQQVFSNLCRNALKFTPSGGTITLRSFTPLPGRISIEIIDSGIGIADVDISHLSRAFEQGSVGPRFGGLGLGLMISRNIIEAHGGTVAIASHGRDKGATIRVDMETRAPPGKAPPPSVKEIGTLRILLVEDHALTRKTLARLLCRQNYTVKEASNVASAKEAAKHGTFDLLISDIGLPDGNGREIMRYVHDRFGLHGIAFSGFGMEQDIETSRRAGFSEYLVKPVEWPTLNAAIRRVAYFPKH